MTNKQKQGREEILAQYRYLSASDIMEKLNISRSGLFDLARRGKFPAPMKLGRLCRWKEQDIINWLNQQSADE